MTATATLVPPAGLVKANPQGADKPPLFALFSSDWLTLQSFIVQTLQLPISAGDFETKYGKFTSEQKITGVVAAMKSIQGLSAQFGDPQALIDELKKDPAILQGPTAPAALYTHIVWFADKLYQAANSYNQTLGDFEQLLNPTNCGTPAACGEMLKSLLTGTGGLQSTAADMVTKANVLVQAFATFEGNLKPSVDTMTTYTAADGSFMKEVEADLTQDSKDITTYTNAAAAAYKEWEDFTIAAVTVSIGLMIFSGGLAWPAAAAAAGVLGHEAVEAREAYDKALNNEANSKEDQKEKRQLKSDLLGLNTSMPNANAAAKAFLAVLQEVMGVWTNVADNIAYIADNFTVEKLGDLNWVSQALDLDKATKDWKVIADVSESYTSNSLVTYTILPAGSALPS